MDVEVTAVWKLSRFAEVFGRKSKFLQTTVESQGCVLNDSQVFIKSVRR